MIYYFSGTGNTRHVAELLRTVIKSEAKNITQIDPRNEVIREEDIVFMFPIYAWGIPPVMIEFISRLPENLFIKSKKGEIRLWGVATCGDETGMAMDMLKDLIGRKGGTLRGIWSIQSPNVYVLLPGFNTDPISVEEEKIKMMKPKIEEIGKKINQADTSTDIIEDYYRGRFPKIKTKLVYPLFVKWGISTRKWHWTKECIGCGKCAGVCPEHNIVMEGGHPRWGNNCDSCLACYHVCPTHAIEYGKVTDGKGQFRKWLK